MGSDPMRIREKGFRFIVKGDFADWVHPQRIPVGGIDATNIEDTDELANLIIQEQNKVKK